MRLLKCLKRASKRRLWFALPIVFIVLFYGIVGYWGSGLLISKTPRWRGMDRGPGDLGLQSETVSFEATDGVPLKGWWLPAPADSRGTVIIAPGVDHTRQVMLPRAAFLVRGGYNVLAIDIRGHGESGGNVISPGSLERRDILGAIRYVRSRDERGPIALMGICLGGVAALFAASESPEVQAVVSDSAFPSARDVFKRFRSRFVNSSRARPGQTGLANGRNPLVRALFAAAYLPGIIPSVAVVYYMRSGVWLGLGLSSVVPAASRISCPVLVVSGDKDWIVPPADARRLFAAIPGERKKFLNIANAAHDTTYSEAPDLYRNAVLEFLDDGLKK